MRTLYSAILAACLAAPTAAQGRHAELHPGGALLYLEVPDVRALYGAYTKTALARMLTDAELQAAIGEVMGQEAVDPIELARGYYRKAVADGEMPPLDELFFEPLRAVSFSLSVEGGRADALVRAMETAEAEGTDPGQVLLQKTGFQLELEFDGPESAAAFLRFVARSCEEEGIPLTLVEGEDATRGSVTSGDPVLDTLRFVRSGSRLGVFFGETIEGARGISSEALRAGTEHFTGAGTTVFELSSVLGEQLLAMPEAEYVGPILDLAEGLLGPLLTMSVRGGRWRVVITPEGRFVTEGVHSESPHPLDGVFASEPLERSALSMVHPDAIVGWAVHLDKEPLLALIHEQLAKLSEDPFAEIEQKYDFRPDRDLLAPLGDAIAYSLPAPKSLLSAPPLMFSAALKDKDAFVRGLDGLVRVLADEGPDIVSVSTSEYRGTRLYTLQFDFGTEDLGLPIDPSVILRPTIAVMDERVFLTTLPNHAKREIKRVLKQDTELHGIFAEGFPSDSSEVAFADWIQFLGKIYTGAKAVAPMLLMGADPDDIPFDLTALPNAELLTRHFSPTKRWRRNVKGGVLHHQESSFGPETPALFAGVAGAAFLMSASTSGPVTPPEELVIEVVDLPQPEGPWASTFAKVQQLKVAMTIYKIDHGGYPARLADLTKPSVNYPKGFLNGADVGLDAWGNAFRFTVDGEAVRIWSTGPDGVDQDGGGDDIQAR